MHDTPARRRFDKPPLTGLRLPALLIVLLALSLAALWWLTPRPGTPAAPTPPTAVVAAPAPAPAPTVVRPSAPKPRPAPASPATHPPATRPAALRPSPAPATPSAADAVASAAPHPVAEQLATAEPAPADPAPSATPKPAPRVLVPAPLRLKFTIHGKVSFIPYRAHGELLWRHNGHDYQSRLELGAFLLGTRVIDSRGHITADGLKPTHFGDKIRDPRSAEFHYDKAEVRFSEGAPPAPLLAGAQDQLSIFIQLASLIGAAPTRYPAGSQIDFQTIGVYGSDDWRFIVNAKEHLKLPGGEVDVLKLTHPPRHADEPKVELWLSPAHGWLPLRIRLSQDNGDFIDQLWQSSETP